jgi:hypothetical protein
LLVLESPLSRGRLPSSHGVERILRSVDTLARSGLQRLTRT